MNRIILIIGFLFLALTGWSQKVQLVSSTDTLTNADTVTVLMPLHQDRQIDYSLHVFADSLSGSTAGTVLLQHKLSDSGSDWVTLATVTIDGVTSSGTTSGTVLGGEFRIYATSSGTQSTAMRSYIAYVRSKD